MAAYKLWHECVQHFPRTARYTLGGKVDTLFQEVLELILIASFLSKTEKLPYVKKAAIKLDALKFFLQVAWEIRAIDAKKYITLSEKLYEVGRMLGGWVKQLSGEQKRPDPGRNGK